MGKIKTIKQIVEISNKLKAKGKTISLITGCFDIVHIGHVELFRYAKKHSDIVVVGLENDENIRTAKGKNRPYHNFRIRSEVLSEFQSIDLIFQVEERVDFGSPSANKIYRSIYKKIKPTFLITNPLADRFWKKKEMDAKEIGAKLLKDYRKRITSSTTIADRLQMEE